MVRSGVVGVAASLILAAVSAFPASAAVGYAIRLPADIGYGSPYLRIVVDDPNTTTPGPAADVGAGDFTIELFVRGTTADNDAAVDCGAGSGWTGARLFADRHRIGGGESRSFGAGISSGKAVFGVTGAGGASHTLCGSRAIMDGFWHHVAVQRRRSDGRMTIWVDGALDASADGPDGDVSYPDDAAVPLCGAIPCTQEQYLFVGGKKETLAVSLAGSVDELRISTKLRYASAFARPSSAFAVDAATAALYHFDEGSGTVAGDAAGSSDATLSGGQAPAQWFQASPFGGLPATTSPTARPSPGASSTPTAPGQQQSEASAPAQPGASASAAQTARAAGPAIGRDRVARTTSIPSALLTAAAILAVLGFVVAMIVFGIRAADRS